MAKFAPQKNSHNSDFFSRLQTHLTAILDARARINLINIRIEANLSANEGQKVVGTCWFTRRDRRDRICVLKI
jgi:hypothetical protein